MLVFFAFHLDIRMFILIIGHVSFLSKTFVKLSYKIYSTIKISDFIPRELAVQFITF